MRCCMVPLEESLLIGLPLAYVGGFLDAYTYLYRGGVFAFAQTGNMILFSIHAAGGDFQKALLSLVPIAAFSIGVLAAEWMKIKVTSRAYLAWRHVILAIEAVLLTVIGFLPLSVPNLWVNASVSFLCSLQISAFRRLNGMAYATTMCTGNLRSGMEMLSHWIFQKDKEAGRHCIGYFLVILFFCAGAASGRLLGEWMGVRSSWLCAGILLALLAVMLREERKRSAQCIE